MANFDQRGQVVRGNQNNGDTFIFNDAKLLQDSVICLNDLAAELKKAIQSQTLMGESADSAERHLEQAIVSVTSPMPCKKTILEHLDQVKEVVTGVDGLMVAVSGAMATIGSWIS